MKMFKDLNILICPKCGKADHISDWSFDTADYDSGTSIEVYCPHCEERISLYDGFQRKEVTVVSPFIYLPTPPSVTITGNGEDVCQFFIQEDNDFVWVSTICLMADTILVEVQDMRDLRYASNDFIPIEILNAHLKKEAYVLPKRSGLIFKIKNLSTKKNTVHLALSGYKVKNEKIK